MPKRRPSKWTQPPRDLNLAAARGGVERTEWSGGHEWNVRRMSVDNAAKDYTCPGCGHSIPPRVAHLVVWRLDHWAGEEAGLSERRHWHERCWKGR